MASRVITGLGRKISHLSRNCNGVHHRMFVSVTVPVLDKHTIKVPTMGDSITEGTIVEWTAEIGQMVKDGDVVALVETDKVTIDIKAEMDGVITQHFGEIEESIEVGANLYEIDTEAEATVEASSTTTDESPATEESSAPVAGEAASESAAPAQVASQSSHRTPSIHFLGKEGWMRRKTAVATNTVIYGVPKNYGRPTFTDDEMEALMTGGANLVPDVKQHSSGAVFTY